MNETRERSDWEEKNKRGSGNVERTKHETEPRLWHSFSDPPDEINGMAK